MDHAFAVGHRAVVEPTLLRRVPSGDYQIQRLLPDQQYRIKSLKDNHERVAHESDLRLSKKVDAFARWPERQKA